jgi:hypothetical protein
MTFARDLPEPVMHVIRSASVCEFATVSAANVPIDTPTFVFPDAAMTTLDVATGLSYPAKAERARRNPKVGLTYDAVPGQPVVAIAGMARVVDADLQANLDRYLAETVLSPPVSTQFTDWSITRKAVWYLTRIFVSITPAHVRWWDSLETMDQPPHEWRAPSGTVYPGSDPAPAGKASPASDWPQLGWRELAERALANQGGPGGLGYPGHLTLLDDEGYPISIRSRSVSAVDGGFRIEVPAGAPWSNGMATLSFGGVEVFVGAVHEAGGALQMQVERALPILPTAREPMQVLEPTEETRRALTIRLEHEARRRGQAIPTVPAEPPPPTEGALCRAAASAELMEQMNQVRKAAHAGPAAHG